MKKLLCFFLLLFAVPALSQHKFFTTPRIGADTLNYHAPIPKGSIKDSIDALSARIGTGSTSVPMTGNAITDSLNKAERTINQQWIFNKDAVFETKAVLDGASLLFGNNGSTTIVRGGSGPDFVLTLPDANGTIATTSQNDSLGHYFFSTVGIGAGKIPMFNGTNWTVIDTSLISHGTGGGSSTWGGITGTLSNQTDLAAWLAGKKTTTLDNGAIWIGNGEDTAEAQYMSGDVTINRMGVTTIGNNKIALGQMATTSSGTWLGRSSAGTGNVEAVTTANLKTALSLNNVENTVLSTWAGSTYITTLGTVTAGTWHGSVIPILYGGTGASTGNTAYDALLGISSGTGYIFRSSGGAYSLQSSGTGTVTSVGLSLPVEFTISGSPVTTSGTLAAGWASEGAGTFMLRHYASGVGTPGFGTPVYGDFPWLADTLTARSWRMPQSLTVGHVLKTFATDSINVGPVDVGAVTDTEATRAYARSIVPSASASDSAVVAGTDMTRGVVGTTIILNADTSKYATASASGFLKYADWTTFNNKAPTASPTFTGTPIFTLTSDAAGDIWYRAVTTGYMTRLALGSAGYRLGVGTNAPAWVASDTAGMGAANAGVYAPKASPTFTGTVTMPKHVIFPGSGVIDSVKTTDTVFIGKIAPEGGASWTIDTLEFANARSAIVLCKLEMVDSLYQTVGVLLVDTTTVTTMKRQRTSAVAGGTFTLLSGKILRAVFPTVATMPKQFIVIVIGR